MYPVQNDIPSENTLKHVSSHTGFTDKKSSESACPGADGHEECVL